MDAADLHAKLDLLERRLETVERRLRARVSGGGVPSLDAPVPTLDTPEPAPSHPTGHSVFDLPLVGRTLVVLAGAFLLRAATEANLVPKTAGTWIGVAYAMLWLVIADVAVARGRRVSAIFHGIAAALIAFPLLWEATARFGFLSAPTAAGALCAVTGLALLVAQHRGLRRLAWVFTAGAVATALALAAATKSPLLFAVFLLLLALTTLWLGHRHGWPGPGRLAAIALDLTLLLLTLIVLVGDEEQVARILRPSSVVAFQLSAVLAYLGSYAAQTLARGRPILYGEIAQGQATLVLGLVGALTVTRAAGLPTLATSAAGFVLAICGYGVAFAFSDRREGARTNFIFYSTVGLAGVLVAVLPFGGGSLRSSIFSLFALATAWLGARGRRVTLSLHGAIYLLAAAVDSGLVTGALRALFDPTFGGSRWIGLPALVVLAVTAVACLLPMATHRRTWGALADVPAWFLWILLVVAVGGVLVSLTAGLLPLAADGTLDAGGLAALRTAVFALGAVVLAGLSRYPRFRHAAGLVNPLLVLTGLKLLLEDVRAGRAATLVVSLVLYGGALIVASRVVRRIPQQEISSSATPPTGGAA